MLACLTWSPLTEAKRCMSVYALPDSTRWIHLAMDIDEWLNALTMSVSYDITMQSTLIMTMDGDPKDRFFPSINSV